MLLLQLMFNKRKLDILKKEREVIIIIPFDKDAIRLAPGDGIALMFDSKTMEKLLISSMAVLPWDDEYNVPYTTGILLKDFLNMLGYKTIEEYQERIKELKWKPGEYAMLKVIARPSFGNPEQSEQKESDVNGMDSTNTP